MLLVRLWAAAAWADGKMHPAEAAALERLIAHSDDLDGDRRKRALAFLKSADVDPREVRILPPEAREGVYRAALGIVRLDGEVSESEKQFLGKLRAVIGLDDAVLARIEKEPR